MNKDYDFKVITTIRVKDVEDEFMAQSYLEDYLAAAYEMSLSDDEEDDHYEYLDQQKILIAEQKHFI